MGDTSVTHERLWRPLEAMCVVMGDPWDSMGIDRSPWETHGSSWEHHWNFMRALMEIHGGQSDTHARTTGHPMGYHYQPVKVHGSPWENHGSSWEPMGYP